MNAELTGSVDENGDYRAPTAYERAQKIATERRAAREREQRQNERELAECEGKLVQMKRVLDRELHAIHQQPSMVGGHFHVTWPVDHEAGVYAFVQVLGIGCGTRKVAWFKVNAEIELDPYRARAAVRGLVYPPNPEDHDGTWAYAKEPEYRNGGHSLYVMSVDALQTALHSPFPKWLADWL